MYIYIYIYMCVYIYIYIYIYILYELAKTIITERVIFCLEIK